MRVRFLDGPNITMISLLLLIFFIGNLRSPADTILETTRTTTTETSVPSSSILSTTLTPPDETLMSITKTKVTTPEKVTTFELTEPPAARAGKENFARRLQLMKEQLDKGINNGWLSAADAASFNSQYANLLAQIETLKEHDPSYSTQANELERQLNSFNIDLSQKLSMSSTNSSQ